MPDGQGVFYIRVDKETSILVCGISYVNHPISRHLCKRIRLVIT